MAIDRSRVAALALMLAAPVPGQVASQWVRKQDLLPTQRALAVASDPVRRRLVLFGGGFGPEYGTWEFDGAAWSPRFPAAAPPDRWWHGMVWDAARQRVVLFGGTGGPGVPTDDTWEWDGRVWSRIATRTTLGNGTVSTGPSAREPCTRRPAAVRCWRSIRRVDASC